MTAPRTFRVMALHALVYCERLFYLEEVEEIRVADDRVWAGRRLHLELDEPTELVEMVIESASLGLRGKFDAVRRRNGEVFPVEHKRGRSYRGKDGAVAAWESDRVQALAYAMLLEEHEGVGVPEARVRYHKDNQTVRIPLDDAGRASVRRAVERACQLAGQVDRPPVSEDERRCVRCSLAPVCLPEESRLIEALRRRDKAASPVRLYPPDCERRSLHVVGHRAKLGRRGERLRVSGAEKGDVEIGVREVSDVVLHGHAQITTQALRHCAVEGIPVHWVASSGGFIGSFSGGGTHVQRRVRQYRGLCDEVFALDLSRRVVVAKIELQMRHLLRATRGDSSLRGAIDCALDEMRACIRLVDRADGREALMGYEGNAARAYFRALPHLVAAGSGEEMRPDGRSRRPPRDRFNALLSFAYTLLYRDVVSAIVRVGLEPAFGFFHRPHSASFPLAHDLVELFRVPVADMAVLGAVNRRTFDPAADFTVTKPKVWMSDVGRKKLIAVYERRKHEEHRHPSVGYSLSYARMMELEVRLLEKEWSGEPGLFARLRLR